MSGSGPGALAGDLAIFYPAEVLQLLRLARATGRLDLERGDERVEVFIEEGRPMFARSSGPSVRTGDILIHRGEVSREALDMAHDPTRGRETVCWDAEFERMRAELAGDEADGGAVAIHWYERALTTARRQGARSLELRAALGYAKMLSAAGRGSEAVRLLRPIVDAFTEGDDTVELREARALLAAGS